MFRYELVNSTRKFTIVAEIVSLLKKIYKRDAPSRAMFKVKTLAVLFSPYPREMKHLPRNLNLPPYWRLLVTIEMVQFIPTVALSRARGLSMRTHLTAVDIHIAKNLFSIRHEWYKNLGDNTVLAREMFFSGCRPRKHECLSSLVVMQAHVEPAMKHTNEAMRHSLPQRPRSFWSAPRFTTSGPHSGQMSAHA